MDSIIAQLLAEIEASLCKVFEDFQVAEDAIFWRNEIIQAHNHPLAAGGKRIRPIIVSLIARALAGQSSQLMAERSGLALECIHTYSLVHDDLPCMDNDDFRRGKPTTHRLYGDAKALLVGDGLLTRAFEILAAAVDGTSAISNPRLLEWCTLSVRVLSNAAGFRGMVLGQWIDMSKFSESQKKSCEIWETIAVKKTGCLLGAAFELGVLSGLAVLSPNSVKTLYSKNVDAVRNLARQCGEHVGLAFQIVDDVLDVTALSETMGKTVGKDEQQDKLTAVQIWGLEGAQKEAQQATERALNLLRELFAGLRVLAGINLDSAHVGALECLVVELLARKR